MFQKMCKSPLVNAIKNYVISGTNKINNASISGMTQSIRTDIPQATHTIMKPSNLAGDPVSITSTPETIRSDVMARWNLEPQNKRKNFDWIWRSVNY